MAKAEPCLQKKAFFLVMGHIQAANNSVSVIFYQKLKTKRNRNKR